MASSGTPSPSESPGVVEVTQGGARSLVAGGAGAAWVVPMGLIELGRVSALRAASTSSWAVTPISPVAPLGRVASPVLSESPQPIMASILKTNGRENDRPWLRNILSSPSPSIHLGRTPDTAWFGPRA